MSRSIFSVMDDGTTFAQAVMASFDSEFRPQWERLTGLSLLGAKGKTKAMGRFVADVKDLVWDRLPGSAFALDLTDDPDDYRPGVPA